MKSLYSYYVVDTLTESIVTSYEAISDDMAKFILNRLLNENEKVKAIGQFLILYRGSERIVCETFNDVVSNDVKIDFSVVEG